MLVEDFTVSFKGFQYVDATNIPEAHRVVAEDVAFG